MLGTPVIPRLCFRCACDGCQEHRGNPRGVPGEQDRRALSRPLLKLDMLYMALEAMDWMHRFLPMLRYSSPGLSFEFTRLPALEIAPEAEPWRAQSQIGAVLLVP